MAAHGYARRCSALADRRRWRLIAVRAVPELCDALKSAAIPMAALKPFGAKR